MFGPKRIGCYVIILFFKLKHLWTILTTGLIFVQFLTEGKSNSTPASLLEQIISSNDYGFPCSQNE